MLPGARKGRGTTLNPEGRFERFAREAVDDGWGSLEALAEAPAPTTEVFRDRARTIIARNDSPDVPFDRSINPYRGCEHGCVYCYARPSHAHLGLSAGLDFETRIFVKAVPPGSCRKSWRGPAMPAGRSRWAPTPIPTSSSSGGSG
jgi:hypothetical protein